MVTQVHTFPDFLKDTRTYKGCIVDFTASWCGPCKVIAPYYEALAQNNPNIYFMKVDVDECDDIATAYQVTGMPTFVGIVDGNVVTSFSGASKEKLDGLVDVVSRMIA